MGETTTKGGEAVTSTTRFHISAPRKFFDDCQKLVDAGVAGNVGEVLRTAFYQAREARTELFKREGGR